MPSFKVPGAELFYETHGSGPLLVFIAGAGGSGNIFLKAAAALSAHFTVITYDRRGHSLSALSGEQDYAHRLERDADDVAELIKHVASSQGLDADNNPSAYVLGTSSGAIVALTVLCRHPSIIKNLICHEPPMYNALSDADERRVEKEKTRAVYDDYRARGVHAALMDFGKINFSPEDTGAMLTTFHPRTDPFIWGNILYWFERELLVYPYIEVPWSVLESPEVRGKLIMGVSQEGAHFPAGRTAVAMAKRLGMESDMVKFPGAHLGYATRPDEFAACLKNCLNI